MRNPLKLGLCLSILFCCNSLLAQKTIQLGVVMDCPNPSAEFLINRILQEAEVLLDDDVNLDEDKILKSNCDLATVRTSIDQLLRDDEVDLILSIDAISSHILAQNGPYEKPVIAGVVINAQVQDLPITEEGNSGVKNVTYLELPYSPLRDLEVFSRMIGFERVALTIDEIVFEGIPEIGIFLEKGLVDLGVDYEFIFNEPSASEVLAKIDDAYDAIYFFPSDKLNDQEYQALIQGANARKLRSFSVLGRPDVDNGVLGGIAPSSNIDLMARRIALNIQRIANDEDPEDLNVKMRTTEELVINMATARAIDYSPSWEVLSEAVLINEERDDIERSVNIFSAINEGLEENLSIDISRKEVSIADRQVAIARSGLLPEVTASASHTLLDNNTATISAGQNPENRGAAAIQLSQVIYAEQVTANKRIQDILLKATDEALNVQVLDIVLEVATTYLNLMQAKTAENIQKENLEVTRKNLELARVSTSIGQSGPSDLYRWQGEIATAKFNLLNATAQRRNAEIALNQILNRPIDEDFVTEEVDVNDSRLLINNDVIDSNVQNPRQFGLFADFMVEEAKANTPDLRQFDYNIQAQERSVLLSERLRYVPNVSVGGSYNHELYRGGAGSEFQPPFVAPNDWNWSLQLGASLPIFQGGNRTAQVQQSRIQLDQLNVQRLNTERLIEQQVRSQLENIIASYTNIELSQDAERAVTQNFELIQDSYAKGIVTITQLLDAQNASVSARLNSANAVYIFLIDLLNMERATGNFYMLMTQEQKDAYLQRLVAFFNQ